MVGLDHDPPEKPSTRAGFRPPRPFGILSWKEAHEALRLDGKLEQLKLNPRLHIATLNHARLGNLVSSYQIEGFRVSRQEAEEAIRDGGGDRPVHKDMTAFARKYEELHRAPQAPRITVDLIRGLHGALFTPQTLDHGKPGEWKTDVNGIFDQEKGRWVFLATPKEETVAELEALLRWYETEARELPPAWAAAIFFAEFEAIHPFADGNGRIGRLLNLLVLKDLGHENAFLVPLDEGFLARREAYYQTLATSNSGKDYSAWCAFYTRELALAYGRALDAADFARRSGKELKPAAREVLGWVLAEAAESWFKRGDYPNASGYSESALTQALAELAQAGLLHAEGERKARRYKLRWD